MVPSQGNLPSKVSSWRDINILSMKFETRKISLQEADGSWPARKLKMMRVEPKDLLVCSLKINKDGRIGKNKHRVAAEEKIKEFYSSSSP